MKKKIIPFYKLKKKIIPVSSSLKKNSILMVCKPGSKVLKKNGAKQSLFWAAKFGPQIVNVITWERVRKGKGKIATTTRKKLKEKNKKYNLALAVPVRKKTQLTKRLNIWKKQIQVIKSAIKKKKNKEKQDIGLKEQLGIKHNLKNRLFAFKYNLSLKKKSNASLLTKKILWLASDKDTSLRKRRRFY